MNPLAFLVGTWTGGGNGEYPTIESFTYEETVTFSTVPTKGFLFYQQKTWRPETKEPMHAETGYLRPTDEGVELVISQPTGLVEVHTGVLDREEQTIRFQSTLVAGSETAVDVTEVTRTLAVTGDTLHYELSMAAVGHGLTHHLAADLHRTV